LRYEKKYYSDICGNLGDGRLAVCIGCTAVVSLTRGRTRVVSFSCRGNPPVVALMPETPTKSWMRRVGTGSRGRTTPTKR
jgi:hypothetical protein